MYKNLQAFILLILIGLLTACAGIPLTEPEAPKVSVACLRLVKAKLSEQTYRLRLRFKNPNSFPLPIAGMNFHLYINDKKFTSGMSKQSMTIPAFGEQFLDIEIVSNLMDIVEGLQDWKRTLKNSKLNYRLVGSVRIMGWAPQIPFEHEALSWRNL
jgi:LEA14-like dessication related protein